MNYYILLNFGKNNDYLIALFASIIGGLFTLGSIYLTNWLNQNLKTKKMKLTADKFLFMESDKILSVQNLNMLLDGISSLRFKIELFELLKKYDLFFEKPLNNFYNSKIKKKSNVLLTNIKELIETVMVDCFEDERNDAYSKLIEKGASKKKYNEITTKYKLLTDNMDISYRDFIEAIKKELIL